MRNNDLKSTLLINTPFLPLSPEEIEEFPVSKQSRISVAPPLSICYLSSFMKSKGYTVQLLDLEVEIFYLLKKNSSYNLDEIVALIKKKMESSKAGVVGISCFTSARYKQAHKIAEIVKSVNKNVRVVLGGNYPTNSPILAMQDINTDFIVLGEGELIFWNLLEALSNNKNLNSVSGIGYKKDGRINITKRNFTDFIYDLDTLPLPDYKTLCIEKYYDIEMSQSLEGNFRFFTVFSSRGCPWQCIFCGARNIFGRKYRARSAENVLKEIDWLITDYNAEEIQFQDDNLTFDKKRAEAIFDGLIIRGSKIPWTTPNGLDSSTLDKGLLEKIKKSGGRDLSIAVESGNPRVLRMVGKHIDLNKIRELVRIMQDLGIYSKAFFMLGFPGETKQEMEDTINYAAQLKADWVMFSIVNPLPGTEMSEAAFKKCYFSDNILKNIGYLNANLKTEEFTPEYVEEIAYDANIKINFLHNPNLNKRDINIAIRDFSRIAERYPDHAIARYCLAKALIKKGLKQQALNELEKLQIWQKNTKCKLNLLTKYKIDIDKEIEIQKAL